jgi:hypothetical protein
VKILFDANYFFEILFVVLNQQETQQIEMGSTAGQIFDL